MSAQRYLVVLGDGRFVALMMGRRYFVREYPDAQKFTKGQAQQHAKALGDLDVPCSAVGENDYAEGRQS